MTISNCKNRKSEKEYKSKLTFRRPSSLCRGNLESVDNCDRLRGKPTTVSTSTNNNNNKASPKPDLIVREIYSDIFNAESMKVQKSRSYVAGTKKENTKLNNVSELGGTKALRDNSDVKEVACEVGAKKLKRNKNASKSNLKYYSTGCIGPANIDELKVVTRKSILKRRNTLPESNPKTRSLPNTYKLECFLNDQIPANFSQDSIYKKLPEFSTSEVLGLYANKKCQTKAQKASGAHKATNIPVCRKDSITISCDKSTQMYDYITCNDLFCLEWIHNNLFCVDFNPYTMVLDDKLRDPSDVTCITSDMYGII